MNGNPACVILPTQVDPGRYLVRHKIIALEPAVARGTLQSQVLSILHTESASVAPKWLHPTRPSSSQAPAYNHNDLVIYDPSMQASGSVIHFPRWTCVEPRRARGYDLPVVRERPHLNRVCKLQKRDVPLSRGDMGVEQHKRHKTFMRAVCDVFYHSQSRAVGRVLAFPCSPSFPE